MATYSHFLDLPSELQVKILSSLDPEGIVSVRQTCKHLRDVEKTFHDAIWKGCLTQMTLKHPLFPPTFQTPISSKCLESIARRVSCLEPTFLQYRNGHQSRSELQPVPSFQWDIWHDHLVDVEIDEVYLLPGGRFLLIVTELWLQVWDLAPFLESHEAPAFIKRFPVPLSPTSTVMATSDGDAATVQILLAFEDFELEDDDGYPTNAPTVELRRRFQCHLEDSDEEWWSVFVMYELRFSGKEPQLTKLGDIGLIRDLDSQAELDDLNILTDNRALLFVDGSMVVWDFKNHSYHAWRVTEREYDPQDITVFTSQGIVFYRQKGELVMFEIPPLTPIQDANRKPQILRISSIPFSPYSSHIIRLPLRHDRLTFDSSMEPYSESKATWGLKDSDNIVFSVHDFDRNDTITTWYGLLDAAHPRTSTVKALGREKVGYHDESAYIRTIKRDYDSRELVASLCQHPRLGSKHVWDVSVFACLSSRYSVTQEDSSLEIKPLYPIRLADVPSETCTFDFDPFSGILVAAGYGSVRVIDIARPSLPSSSLD
ncbi:hypothetical protein CC1G_14075 [Coprinopsis cinerea okayama7|uniref:F-box domain-containing protein n=1 Tax=Coprinopsis cinerea (strain Okayama-7 / 130 / ATCC MYA-4618 / FGSC 9003) TaxID=240176 RepID=D6RL48_COPC7|nr:hypothetical protein CC1G_14075 [Coprinopsis cinerea okayama7\|eukprot:XP_002911543.1 hypothetical protein CC1G_14075 [Coprinopsis cinerea okayama7\